MGRSPGFLQPDSTAKRKAVMMKKVLLLMLAIAALFLFYKKFMADTMEPLFKKHKNNVDLFQSSVPDYEAKAGLK